MIVSNSRIFGWLIDSSAPTESGPMGATLEIQRSQQMEALEQHMMQRQQVKNNLSSFVNLSLETHFWFAVSTKIHFQSFFPIYFSRFFFKV